MSTRNGLAGEKDVCFKLDIDPVDPTKDWPLTPIQTLVSFAEADRTSGSSHSHRGFSPVLWAR